MNQKSNPWLRWGKYLLAALVVLILVYGVGRFFHVASGSLYDGARAPYLQLRTPTSVTIHWQSVESETGYVRYAPAESPLLTADVFEQESSHNHQVTLSQLKPNTKYYYAVGAKGRALSTSGTEDWFVTAPKVGSTQPVRIWVIGDPGYSGTMQNAVRDAMLKWTAEHPRADRPYLDLWLTTGDNAYTSGSNEQFQQGFFRPYKNILRNIPVWPAYGNHDARRWAFFEIFNLPQQAEVGGVPSGTENYYSFDYANIHFVFLDSQDSSLNTDGDMAAWLQSDLAATQQQWLITVFHHPPYSKGSHDSDNDSDSGGRMGGVRQNILPILEKAGVDLVLTGHSHMYERSYLLDCHYGDSTTLKPYMILDKGGNQAAFKKHSAQLSPHEGAVYEVVGSSSKVDAGPLDHPVMAKAMAKTGSMIIDVEGLRLVGRFIGSEGEVLDRFSILKGVEGVSKGREQCP